MKIPAENLKRMFKAQDELDQHIINNKKLWNKSLIDNKIMAMLTEIAETANEVRHFKHWSEKPGNMDKALVEFVDIVHFVLSIGNEIGFDKYELLSDDVIMYSYPNENKTDSFFDLVNSLCNFRGASKFFANKNRLHEPYESLFKETMRLGKTLGFTWDEIEQAYYGKNSENHARQESGY